MEPQIQYARTADDVSIAYGVMGAGLPLIFVSNVMGDLQWYTHNEATRGQVDMLVAAGCQVVRYDGRGMGSSGRDVVDFSLEARLLDLEAVVECLGIERFALCGYVHGSPPAMLHAVRHPERVSHLALVNPFAMGSAYYEKTPAVRTVLEMREMMDDEWEFFTQAMAGAMGGFREPAQAQPTAALFRSSISPAGYLAFSHETQKIDLRDVLGAIAAPTLVVIDRSGIAHADSARAVAAAIRGSRLVTTDDYVRELSVFLALAVVSASPPPAAASLPHSGTAIILFADIADSTALTERMGDSAFREKARALDDALRIIVRDNGGLAIDGKLVGDGIMATFPAASRAITAALAYESAAATTGLGLHIGLHAGDVMREANNVYGGAVNIASRISTLAAPGEVLVSDIVRGLARTSAGVTFEDRGEHALKGIAEPQRVFAVQKGGE